MGVRLRDWEFGLRDWEIGLRGWEFGLKGWEFGLRDWEIGLRGWEFGLKGWEFGLRGCEFGLRDWEFGLKAQKPLAQGNALGNVIAINRPERAKALFTAAIMLLPFQGVLLPMHTNPGCRFALPWAMCFCPFRAFLLIVEVELFRRPELNGIYHHVACCAGDCYFVSALRVEIYFGGVGCHVLARGGSTFYDLLFAC